MNQHGGINPHFCFFDSLVQTLIDAINEEEIGVDDVAIKKGIKYATAIYDMKDHHLIALLDVREGKTLKEAIYLNILSRNI